MSTLFCLTVHFLQPMCHGRGDGGETEWPPSPLRVFQALVAACAARWNEQMRIEHAVPALRWLERQQSPSIVATVGERSPVKYRLYVPDNVGDKVAGSWSRGGNATIADYRTEKDVRPTHLMNGNDAVHYLWPLSESDSDFQKHQEVLFSAVPSITHLGWGIDMVAADASVIVDHDADKFPGERWRPTDDGSAAGYRVPMEGTIDALITRHEAFLNRIGPEGFHPVPPLSTFRVVGYRRATDPPHRPFAAFSLLRPDGSEYRTFDSARRGVAVAGMMRCVAKEAALRARPNDELWINQVILGHAEARGEPYRAVAGPRLAYIPLPSIEFRGEGHGNVVGAIRRVLVTVLAGDQREKIEPSDTSGNYPQVGRSDRDEIDWLGRILSGMDLIPDRGDECAHEPKHSKVHLCKLEWEPPQLQQQRRAIAMLSRIPANDNRIRRYTRSASKWATVTPMILPGYDDARHYRRRLKNGVGADEQKRLLGRLDQRIDSLIRKAILQAGFSELLTRCAVIDWRKTGFWPGTDRADRYVVPKKLRKFSRYHVRIHWCDGSGMPVQIPGPICLGAGRFYGVGLFAAEDA